MRVGRGVCLCLQAARTPTQSSPPRPLGSSTTQAFLLSAYAHIRSQQLPTTHPQPNHRSIDFGAQLVNDKGEDNGMFNKMFKTFKIMQQAPAYKDALDQGLDLTDKAVVRACAASYPCQASLLFVLPTRPP